jgi:monoamine oxidase
MKLFRILNFSFSDRRNSIRTIDNSDNLHKMKTNCIIIGAGAAGLMAAVELSKPDNRVLVLEARHRVGGRIYTIPKNNFSRFVESGAEFVHGDLPLTASLLKHAGSTLRSMEGKMYQVYDGKFAQEDFFSEEWELLLRELKKIKDDVTFLAFLQEKFPGEKYATLKEHVLRFVEGYNLADSRKASALALRKEWTEDEDPVQYKPKGGYNTLVHHLMDKASSQGVTIQLSKIVTSVEWSRGNVKVKTSDGLSYEADQALITVPIGVLQRETIRFSPSISRHISASKKIGFGSVVKFLLEFREPFWEKQTSRKMPSLRFIFSDAPVPTWWSQLPDKMPLLTGWLGGPRVEELNESEDQLFNRAASSLAYLFGCTEKFINDQLVAWRIDNWLPDPYSCGAYSYVTLESPSAKKILNTPVEETLFFAGEALDEGPHTGTVEAALASGREAAVKILKSKTSV